MGEKSSRHWRRRQSQVGEHREGHLQQFRLGAQLWRLNKWWKIFCSARRFMWNHAVNPHKNLFGALIWMNNLCKYSILTVIRHTSPCMRSHFEFQRPYEYNFFTETNNLEKLEMFHPNPGSKLVVYSAIILVSSNISSQQEENSKLENTPAHHAAQHNGTPAVWVQRVDGESGYCSLTVFAVRWDVAREHRPRECQSDRVPRHCLFPLWFFTEF